MADTASATDVQPPRKVIYCGVCTLPPEYCEYGGTTKKCSEWLEDHHPSLHAQLYDADAIAKGLSEMSVDAQKRAEKDAKKKEAKAEAAEMKAEKERKESRVIIKRVERNKRKFVTEIGGLEAFGFDLKKVGKEFGKKFATGSSVTKTASGGEEITVQGDVADDVAEWLEESGKVEEGQIEIVEDKKKKKGEGQAV